MPDPHSTEFHPNNFAGLKVDVYSQQELNEFEDENIRQGTKWAIAPRQINRYAPWTEDYVKLLHKKMFSKVYTWAGAYRTCQVNLGIKHYLIRLQMPAALADVSFWIEHQTYSIEEIAVRLHHQVVTIHPFMNGNGRCTRLLSDVFLIKMGQPPFTWGGKNLRAEGPDREEYHQTLRVADEGNIAPLLNFARS